MSNDVIRLQAQYLRDLADKLEAGSAKVDNIEVERQSVEMAWYSRVHTVFTGTVTGVISFQALEDVPSRLEGL